VFLKTYENGVGVRPNGDTIAIAPILVSEEKDLDPIVDALSKALKAVD
jgi:beta-alanine--pyruvate transaminase